jgi:hypothetical protein
VSVLRLRLTVGVGDRGGGIVSAEVSGAGVSESDVEEEWEDAFGVGCC